MKKFLKNIVIFIITLITLNACNNANAQRCDDFRTGTSANYSRLLTGGECINEIKKNAVSTKALITLLKWHNAYRGWGFADITKDKAFEFLDQAYVKDLPENEEFIVSRNCSGTVEWFKRKKKNRFGGEKGLYIKVRGEEILIASLDCANLFWDKHHIPEEKPLPLAKTDTVTSKSGSATATATATASVGNITINVPSQPASSGYGSGYTYGPYHQNYMSNFCGYGVGYGNYGFGIGFGLSWSGGYGTNYGCISCGTGGNYTPYYTPQYQPAPSNTYNTYNNYTYNTTTTNTYVDNSINNSFNHINKPVIFISNPPVTPPVTPGGPIDPPSGTPGGPTDPTAGTPDPTNPGNPNDPNGGNNPQDPPGGPTDPPGSHTGPTNGTYGLSAAKSAQSTNAAKGVFSFQKNAGAAMSDSKSPVVTPSSARSMNSGVEKYSAPIAANIQNAAKGSYSLQGKENTAHVGKTPASSSQTAPASTAPTKSQSFHFEKQNNSFATNAKGVSDNGKYSINDGMGVPVSNGNNTQKTQSTERNNSAAFSPNTANPSNIPARINNTQFDLNPGQAQKTGGMDTRSNDFNNAPRVQERFNTPAQANAFNEQQRMNNPNTSSMYQNQNQIPQARDNNANTAFNHVPQNTDVQTGYNNGRNGNANIDNRKQFDAGVRNNQPAPVNTVPSRDDNRFQQPPANTTPMQRDNANMGRNSGGFQQQQLMNTGRAQGNGGGFNGGGNTASPAPQQQPMMHHNAGGAMPQGGGHIRSR